MKNKFKIKEFSPSRPITHRRKTATSTRIKGADTAAETQTLRGPLLSGRQTSLTPWEEREIVRRRRDLACFEALVRLGLSRAEAAKAVGVSPPTVWRWKKRLKPLTHLCGRKSYFKGVRIPQAVLDRVRRLQLTPMGNVLAWKTVSADPICPADLATVLRNRRTIPAVFLAQTRLKKTRAAVIKGPDFVIENPVREGHGTHAA